MLEGGDHKELIQNTSLRNDTHPLQLVERKSAPVAMKNLMELSSGELRVFEETCRACSGTVQVWVHAFTNEDKEPFIEREQPDDKEDYKKYLDGRQKMVEYLHRTKMPVICFIESNPTQDPNQLEIAKYADLLAVNKSGGEQIIYFVRTYKNNSVPCLVNPEGDPDSDAEIRKQNWDKVCDRLKQVGVRNILLRGRYYRESSPLLEGEELETHAKDFEKDYLRRHPEAIRPKNANSDLRYAFVPRGCVGNAAVQLENHGFKITVSQIVQKTEL